MKKKPYNYKIFFIFHRNQRLQKAQNISNLGATAYIP